MLTSRLRRELRQVKSPGRSAGGKKVTIVERVALAGTAEQGERCDAFGLEMHRRQIARIYETSALSSSLDRGQFLRWKELYFRWRPR